MIERVAIRNYRCFEHVDVPLSPLTVLIGPNDTGKSSFLSAMSHCEAGSKARPGGQLKPGPCSIEIARGGGLEQVGRAHGPLSRAAIADVRLPSQGPPMQSAGVRDSAHAPTLDTGSLPALVDWMLRRDRRRFDAFVEAVRASVPGVGDVHVATPEAASRRLDLVVEGGRVHAADQGSAGVRLMLFFLGLAWHPEPPELVLLEEPENGLHPKRLAEVMGLLRGLTEGVHAQRRTQVVLTTHSPYLLDCVDPVRDGILVFQRDGEGRCSAAPLDPARISAFLDDFGLGEIWSNEGEQGLVG